MKKLLKIIGGLVAFLLLLVVGAVVTVWMRPKLLLNPRNLEWAADKLRETGTDIRWKSVRVSVEPVTGFSKRLQFEFSGLCFDQPEPDLRGCFESAKVGGMVSLAGFRFSVPELGPVALEGGRVLADFSNPSPEKKEEEKPVEESKGDWLPGFLKGTRLRPVIVALEDWQVKLPDRDLGGALNLKGESQGREEERKLRLSLRANAAQKRGTLRPKAEVILGGELSPEGIDARIELLARNLLKEIPVIRLKDCDVSIKREALRTNCPLWAGLPVPPKSLAPFKLPTELGATLVADLKSGTFPPSGTGRLSGDVRLKLSPILRPMFQGRGEVHSRVDGIPARFPRDWKLDTDLDLAVGVRSFEKLVAELDRVNWGVPAPVRVLKGHIEVAARGRADAQAGDVPIKLVSRLSSSSQSFDLDGQGVFHLAQLFESPKFKLDFDLALSKVQLQMPRLSVESPPPLLPDKRIAHLTRKQQAGVVSELKSEPSSKGEEAFSYDVRIHTPQGSPIRLLSNLAQAPIPLNADIRLASGKELQGGIRVTEFPVELFRRKATVDHFDLKFATPMEESPIDGKVSVPYADYTVFVSVISTVGEPRVILKSEPPLPEDQLVATLLFGVPVDELEEDQRESVGDTEAAVRDQALGLASLYALASTPVQSVGYDPSTGVVRARLRVADGTSVTVGGTGSSLNELGVRRRLAKRWSVRTTVENPADKSATSQTTGVSASTFLEWSYQY